MARLNISDLPDALLTEILGLLEPANLHRAALVSQRWHECAHAPQLCRNVKHDGGVRQEQQLRSLLAWLQRHGCHVQRLELRLIYHNQETEELQGSCAAACTQLEDLTVRACPNQPVVAGSWAPALPRLERLVLTSRDDSLQLTASLHPLTALRKLRLCSSESVVLSPGVRLPAGLEELELRDWATEQLPEQLAGLTALHTLMLSVHCSFYGYGALERMPRLRRLHCSNCWQLPACLSRLTGLEELLLYSVGRTSDLAVALQALTRLTNLAILDMRAASHPPASIAGLSRLQRACFTYLHGKPVGSSALPTGPWAASLRQLGASYDTLLLSGPLLAAAGRLEQVGVVGGHFSGAVRHDFPAATLGAASESFWRWCAEHPPLQQLHIQMVSHMPPETAFMAAVEALRGARPALQVPVHRRTFSSPFSVSLFHSI